MVYPQIPCLVIPNLNKHLIIGCDWFVQYKAKINFENRTITFRELEISLPLKFEGRTEEVEINILSSADKTKTRHRYSDSELLNVAEKAEMLTEAEKSRLYELLKNYADIFSETMGRTTIYEHEISMRDEKPFFKATLPIPLAYRAEAKNQIEDMVHHCIIESAQTEYVSPLTSVRKKDSSIRICLDARYLNQRMVKDHILPPRTDELLAKFDASRYMTTLDMTASYWQIPIKRDHRKYTGFLFDNVTYIHNVLPFGLSTSVASFIRALSKILGPDLQTFTLNYVDDLFVFSPSAEKHLQHLEIIFSKLQEANLTIKLRKSEFAKFFLGHII